jgi:hypothetical protein
VRLVQDDQRGRVLGVYYAGHVTTQGLGVLAAGAVSTPIGPSATVAVGVLVVGRVRSHWPVTGRNAISGR